MARREGPDSIWDAEEGSVPLVELTIGDLVDRAAMLYGDAPALVYDDAALGVELELTFLEARAEARRVAKGLLALGIERGEHVAVWAPNLPEWVLLELSLGMIGAVLVAVNPLFRAAELRYVVEQGDVSTLFLWPGGGDRAPLAALEALPPGLLRRKPILLRGTADGVAAAQQPRPGQVGTFAELVDAGSIVTDRDLDRRQAAVKPADAAQIQYTSGTTGFPKGAVLSHRSIINNARLVAARAGIGPGDRYITAMPFFHTGGCVIGVLLSFHQGATLYPLIGFDAAKYLRVIANHRATVSCAVPAMLSAILNHPSFTSGAVDASSLRLAMVGGAPVPVALMEEVKRRIGSDIVIVFGQTEASPIVTQTLIDDDFERKSATVGLPLPFTDVRIARPGSLDPVPVGERGELVARGFGVMCGYYKMPERTAEAIVDGWLRTGDLATMDARGYVNIVGRLKDMVIRGGENLFPVEIESVIAGHPAVAEVAVVGVPDERMGEELCAAVRLRPGAALDAETLRAWCIEQMSRQKVPRDIRFVDGYPMTPSGKIKKFELRMRLIDELGLRHLLDIRTA